MAPKNNKKSEIDKAKRKLFAYSPSKVALALRAIQDGIKVATASRTFQVPRSTLRHKVSGRAPETSGHVGPQPVLGNDIENSLVTWIKECSRAGFPINKDGLLDSVKKIVLAGNLETPFINNRPSRSWFSSFMARHPDVSQKHAEYINKARAIITEERIRKWFEEVTELLGPEGCEVLKEPKRVWNCDETSFFLAPKGGLILAPKGEHVYDTSKNSDKENITTLFTVNAEGEMAPPLTLYKYKRMNQDVVQNAPGNWSIGKTDKGWMTAESFYEYIGNVFIPYLKKEGITLPVILFLDGHKSHLTLHLSTLCRNNGIIVVALVPNTTHMLQPLDVAVLFPLKQCWLKYVRKWRIDHDDEEITKFNLPSALRDILINDPHFADNIKAGFKTCGLYPFDANQVNYKRIINDRSKECSGGGTNSGIRVVESTHLQYLESKISPDLLKDFQQTYSNGLDWTGCIEAVHLYKVWLDFKDDNTSWTYQSHNDQPCLITQSNELVSTTPSAPNTEMEHKYVDMNAALNETNKENKELTYERLVDKDASLTLNNKHILEETEVNTSINSVSSTSSILKNPRDALNLVKSCIKWPEKMLPKCSSTRKRQYIPSVLTSNQWKDIMVAKEKEKQDKEEQRQNKLKNKKEKKSEDGEKAKKKKPKVKKQAIQISESETSEEEERFSIRDSDDTDASEGLLNEQLIENITGHEEIIDDYEIGDFVIFLYDGEHFVGKIESISEEAVLIRAMQKSLKNWKWPDKPDLNLYAKADIKQKIKTPQKTNSKREFFYVPEMAKYWEFVNC